MESELDDRTIAISLLELVKVQLRAGTTTWALKPPGICQIIPAAMPRVGVDGNEISGVLSALHRRRLERDRRRLLQGAVNLM